MNENKAKKDIRFLFTGGHMTPAFAVMDELKARGYEDFHWVGHKYNQGTTKNTSAEYNTLHAKGIPFYPLTAGKFVILITPQNWKTVVRDWYRIPLGFLQARKIIKQVKPDVVVSFGGYLALPIVFFAKRNGIKCVTHEQTIVSGKANRRIAALADKILVSWEKTLEIFPKNKTVMTGNPIRKSVFEIRSNNYSFEDKNLPILYITGGNQGSYNLSRRIFAVLPELLKHFNVIHQTGDSSGRETLTKAHYIRDQLPFDLRYRYIPKNFVGEDEIGEVLNKANILFSRSGANITAEVLALGKLTVFMPIKWSSGGEQRKNALLAEETGLGKMCWQTDVVDEPERVLRYLLDAKKHWVQGIGFNGKPIEECQEAGRKLIKMDAATKIADEIESLL